MSPVLGRTADGFETQFGTNHLGHFTLVNRIAPLIRDGGRLVIVASGGHRFADVDLADPNFEAQPYDPWVAYGRSKTANILFAVEFDRRHKARAIRAAAVHPGAIATDLGRDVPPEQMAALFQQITAAAKASGGAPFEQKSNAQGDGASVVAAGGAVADAIGCSYCEDCQVGEMDDRGGIRPGVRPYALDPDSAKALWAKSEDFVGERLR